MKMIRVLTLTVMMLLSAVVFAGMVLPVPVTVVDNGDGTGMASGDMLSARNAENDIELIGCGIKTFQAGFEFGFCQATMSDGSEEGLSGFCSTMDPDILDAIKATGDYSYIRFNWDAAGECTRIDLSTQSFYLPKGKANK